MMASLHLDWAWESGFAALVLVDGHGSRDRRSPGTKNLVRIVRLFARALLLRCPRCGRAPALLGWFAVRPYCPVCHFRLDRGEPGYFIGAGCLNLVVTELVFAFGLL